MLPRTTSTGSEDGTNGVYALRTGLEERLDNAASVVGSASCDPNANAVTRRGEGNEDDPAIGRVTDTVPARGELLDCKFDPLFGVGCRRRSARLATTRVPVSTGYRLAPSTRSRRGGWPANPVDSLAATRPVRSRLVVEQDRTESSRSRNNIAIRSSMPCFCAVWRALGGSHRGPQRTGMNEPARGSRRPHQGQKRMNAHEVGQRQRGQRSGNAGCDQTRLTLRLHNGQ